MLPTPYVLQENACLCQICSDDLKLKMTQINEGSLEVLSLLDCPPGQVLHFIPETNKGHCCVPVLLPKGYEAKPCTEDGTEDHAKRCPNGTHQPDETSSHHMPHCIADPQCTDEGIRMDLKCVDEYCWPVCICSLEHGKCGLDPYHCTDIEKIKCPWKVLPNCSCSPLDITSTFPTSSSKSVKPIHSEFTIQSSLPTSTSESWTGSTKNIDKDNTTKDGTDKENTWKIPVSITAVLVLVVLVVTVVVLCLHYRRNNDNIWNGDSQESGPGEPAGTEMEAQEMLPRNSGVIGQVEPAEHEEETEPFLSWGSGQDESVGHEVDAQPFSPEDSEESGQSESAGHEEEAQAIVSGALPQDYNGAQPISFEVPHMSLSGNWSPFSSSLFRSHDNTTDQQEVSDETHVKSVVNSANLNEEEEHHSGGVDTLSDSRLYHEGVDPNLSSNGLWSDFHSSILNGTECHDIPQAGSDILQAGSDIPQAGSDIFQAGSDILHAGTITQAGSDILQAGSDIPQAGSDMFQAGSDILHAGSIPQAGSDILQAGSDIPQAGSDILQAGSDILHAGSIPQAGSDILQAGSDIPQAGSDIFQAGSDILHAGSIPQAGSDILHAGSIPQAGSDILQAGSDIPEAGSDIQQAGSDIKQAGSDIQQAGSDMQQAGSDIQQAGFDMQQAESTSQRELYQEDDY